MKSNAYWINKVNEVLADNHQSSTEQIIRINKAYEKAAKDLQKDIDKIFVKYATGHNMTLSEARKALNGKIPNNVDELRLRLAQTSNEELKKSILAELNKTAYKARITRIEALKQSLSVNYKLLADKELKLSKKSYIRTIKEAYYRTCYNFQSGINLAFDVANINTRAVNMILNTEWFGRNYSDSVWNNTQALVDRLDETITSGFLSGKSLKDIAKNIAELSNFGMFVAERLVRSETTFFNNQAALQGYKEVGIEKYVYVATLDARTCSCGKNGKVGCQQLDRKVFKISEQEPSKNCPPMHAFCRCTVRSYINDEILNRAKSRARDPETGKTYLVGNMSYEDWKNQYVKGNSQAELAVKKQRNLSADKKQYKEYKSVLGKEAPKTFEAFQSLKYNEVDKWSNLKTLYRQINWQVKCQENIVIGNNVHKALSSGPANSVFDNYKDGKLESRRYYGSTGKVRLDIDLTNHGNAKEHPIVPHAHDWNFKDTQYEDVDPDLQGRLKVGRELSKAEIIANKDILKGVRDDG